MLFKRQGLTEAMGITLLVVTSSPGGSYSNWWCNLFNADLALGVAMTSVSSILSLGFLPLNLFFYSWLAYSAGAGKNGEDMDVLGAIDFNGIFIALGVVLSAISLGLFVGYKSTHPYIHEYAAHFGSFCGISLILFSAFLGGGGGDADTNLFKLPWSFYFATSLPFFGGLTIATFVSRCIRLSPPEVVAVAIECCYQNVAIATSVAITMFNDPNERAEAVSVPLFYGVIEGLFVGVYCLFAWKMGWTKAPSDEKLCVVISKNYQVKAEDEDETLEEELPKSWVKRLFIPKKVEAEYARNSPDMDQTEATKMDVSSKRGRFESLDVTLATSPASPPGTPGYGDAALVLKSDDVEVQKLATGCLLRDSQYRIEEMSDEFCLPDSNGSASITKHVPTSDAQNSHECLP
jgi:predicted Na+-dependent transporter